MIHVILSYFEYHHIKFLWNIIWIGKAPCFEPLILKKHSENVHEIGLATLSVWRSFACNYDFK